MTKNPNPRRYVPRTRAELGLIETALYRAGDCSRCGHSTMYQPSRGTLCPICRAARDKEAKR